MEADNRQNSSFITTPHLKVLATFQWALLVTVMPGHSLIAMYLVNEGGVFCWWT